MAVGDINDRQAAAAETNIVAVKKGFLIRSPVDDGGGHVRQRRSVDIAQPTLTVNSGYPTHDPTSRRTE